jgi:hypothetical protein
MALDRETLARYRFLQKETVDTQKLRIGIDCCLKKKKRDNKQWTKQKRGKKKNWEQRKIKQLFENDLCRKECGEKKLMRYEGERGN